MSKPEYLHGVLLKDFLNLKVDLDLSHNNYIYDDNTQDFILDCFSYIASNPIGHNHPDLNQPEFEKKLLKVAKTNPSNSDILTEEFEQFVKTFKLLAMPPQFHKVFFVAGGTLAVENAVKTAFDWKIRRLHAQDKLGIKSEDLEIVHFTKAFHGRSGYSLSLTNTDPNKIKYFPKFKWSRFEPVLETDKELEADLKLAELSYYIKTNAKTVAAIIIEPIQGEGGDRHFPEEFHKAMRKLADENDCLLIYDEVQTGLGITGKMWAYQHYGIVPDIICFGKKVQVCGIMVGNRVMSVPGNVFEEKSRINSTWGGNLTDMVRSQRYLEIICQEKLSDNAAVVGAYLLKRLKSLKGFRSKVSNIRGKGLMCAFDLPTSEERNSLVKLMLQNKVLLLGCGDRSVRVRPSLTFSKTDVDVLIAALKKSLKQLG